MKIALVAQPLDSLHPAAETSLGLWCRQAAFHLGARHRVTVFARRGGQRPPTEKAAAGFRFKRIASVHWRLQMPLGLLMSPLLAAGRPFFASPLFCADYFRGVVRELRKDPCDIVHILNFSQLVPMVRQACPGARIVLHMQCEWLTQLDARMIARRLGDADRILGCSRFMVDKIARRFPRHAAGCRTLPNGVDLPPGDLAGHTRLLPPGEKKVLYVGRVSPEKGCHVLLAAFARLAARCPDAVLDIVGPPMRAPNEFILGRREVFPSRLPGHPFTAGYNRFLERSIPPALRNRVRFIGQVPHSRLGAHYRRAEVFVFPSVWEEPFGIPPVEAMAAGVPVVCSDAGGLRETVIDGQTGFRVPPGDPTALADAIARLLLDPARRTAMSQAARAHARLFAWERVSKLLAAVYDEMGAGVRRGAGR